MTPYTRPPDAYIDALDKPIASFVPTSSNIDEETVRAFGEEWTKFQHFDNTELTRIGNEYFDIVSAQVLHNGSYVLDAGCGSGRWALYASQRAGFVEAIDPSNAVLAAAALTQGIPNIRITHAAIGDMPFEDGVFDFAFSLGVLHHIPDTQAALTSVASKVKNGGHVLLYLYYNLDNRGFLYKQLFYLSNILRLGVSKLPGIAKRTVCDALALLIYMPWIGLGRFCKSLFPSSNWPSKIPLYYYTDKSWYIIRNDALDRFGTPLEQRFSRSQITNMMQNAGLTEVVFSEQAPYWHAMGRRK